MSVYFSEKFKQLRKDKDLTQEEIADIFHVSPKCVSRWETGANYPDIELLPHIAIYFKVTLDELLGTEKIQDEKAIREISHNIRTLLEVGKVYEAIDAARKARKEYPVNNAFSFELMEALRIVCSEKMPGYKENIEKYKDEIISLGERALDSDPHNCYFKVELVRQYSAWGMKEEAKKILETLPAEVWDTQEPWVELTLDGEEWRNNQHARICRFAVLLNYALEGYATTSKVDVNTLKKIELRKTAMQIENLISEICEYRESDLITAAEGRAFENVCIAELYCEAGDTLNALHYTDKATQDAVYYCANMDKKAFHGYNINTTPRNLPWVLWEDHLMKPQFDIVRNDARFIKCFDALKANSRELK